MAQITATEAKAIRLVRRLLNRQTMGSDRSWFCLRCEAPANTHTARCVVPQAERFLKAVDAVKP